MDDKNIKNNSAKSEIKGNTIAYALKKHAPLIVVTAFFFCFGLCMYLVAAYGNIVLYTNNLNFNYYGKWGGNWDVWGQLNNYSGGYTVQVLSVLGVSFLVAFGIFFLVLAYLIFMDINRPIFEDIYKKIIIKESKDKIETDNSKENIKNKLS